MPWLDLRKGLHKRLPGLTLQPDVKVDRTLKMLPEGAKIADIGAGGRKITPDTFTIDGFVSENTDLVCDIHAIPLESERFDCIFCTGTLEHVEDPYKAISEIIRLLKTNGVAHIEVPFIQGYHADPHDYWRWTLEGLKLFCSRAGFSEIESGVHIGPASSLNWVLNEFLQTLFNNGKIAAVIGATFRFLPLKYLDYILIRRPSAERVASGLYYVGRK